MCLAVPARVVSVDANRLAIVDLSGVTREVSLALVPDAGLDDYVIIHAGYAIEKLDEREAKETLDLLTQLMEALEGEDESAGKHGEERLA
ncbi:MAG: HypC/HybG/HupF family hydrogenase formation chaperone [Dehalococcoidales bacterium]|nr:HypC/HybG/HupF family hydrogenase formation chaperone [Dehalococcoidales bacterium]